MEQCGIGHVTPRLTFYDFSLALTFRNISTFTELVFVMGLLPNPCRDDAYQRGAGWVREWRRPQPWVELGRVRAPTADEI